MGTKHSKGTTCAEVQALLPRSWSELELLYARFQQEAFRRRVSDPQSQFFLSFPVFRHVVAVLMPPDASEKGGDAWRYKERLLRLFQYLDHKRRQRIVALDFFAGLTLATNGKKAAKFEFLFSLLDNGSLKTLNSCEVMMILTATARGLVMFKTIPPVMEETLRPLARRLLGERLEVARSSLVEKALTDPEIVFFVNELENESVTTADALLAQQGRLMKSVAAIELQIGRVETTHLCTSEGSRRSDQHQLHKPSASSLPSRVLSAEAILRRLQALLLPPAGEQFDTDAHRDTSRAPRPIPAQVKRIDARSLCRFAHAISDGSLMLTKAEANRMVASLNADEFGFVKSGDLLRLIRPWVLRGSSSSPPVWLSVARWAGEWLQNIETMWTRWTAPVSQSSPLSTHNVNHGYKLHHLGNELTYSFKATIDSTSKTASPGTPQQPQDSAEHSSLQRTDAGVRVRMNLHHESRESDVRDGNSSDNYHHSSIVLGFRLRLGITEEEAIDVASAVDRFLSDDEISKHIEFAVGHCEATVTESQLERSSQDPVAPHCLRVRLVLTTDAFALFERHTGCDLSSLIRSFSALFDFATSIKDIICAAESVVASFARLVKPTEREITLASIFKHFDKDKDGLWSLQEFNAFQQALLECALDNTAFMQCFGARREITMDDLADCFQQCSSDTFRTLVEKLGHGSISSQLTGSCAVNIAVDERQLIRLESALSPLQWGQTVFKRLLFVLRSLTDFSCDFHSQSVVALLQALGVQREWWYFVESATPLVKWFHAAKDFLSPKHKEHERDFFCRSIFCSLEDELAKSPQQHELEDQQHNLPQGTSARLAALLAKVQNAGVTFLASVDGIESVSLEGAKMRVECEIENFDLIRLLRKAVKGSCGQPST